MISPPTEAACRVALARAGATGGASRLDAAVPPRLGGKVELLRRRRRRAAWDQSEAGSPTRSVPSVALQSARASNRESADESVETLFWLQQRLLGRLARYYLAGRRTPGPCRVAWLVKRRFVSREVVYYVCVVPYTDDFAHPVRVE